MCQCYEEARDDAANATVDLSRDLLKFSGLLCHHELGMDQGASLVSHMNELTLEVEAAVEHSLLLESELVDPPSVERLRGCVDARGSPGLWGFNSSERSDFEEEVQDFEEVQDLNETENVEENEDLEKLEGIDEILDSNILKSTILITKKKTWTNEEKKAFMEGFKEYGRKWKKIKSAYLLALKDRTSTAIKDFWRNHAVDGARAPKWIKKFLME